MKIFRTFIIGVAMGVADLIPGISGGTVAFLSGIYEKLLENFKNLKPGTFSQVDWTFLLALAGGITLSFVSLSHFFWWLLSDAVYASYLYAFFFGIMLASLVICMRSLNSWRLSEMLLFLMGGFLAFILCKMNTLAVSFKDNAFWQMGCGALAAFAMLLPGISGGFVLNLLGVYKGTIEALSHFTQALWMGRFDQKNFFILASLGIGILFGLLFFSRCVIWLLAKFRRPTVAFFTGVMGGGLRSVWPFGASHHVSLFLSVILIVVGMLLVISLEIKRKSKKDLTSLKINPNEIN